MYLGMVVVSLYLSKCVYEDGYLCDSLHFFLYMCLPCFSFLLFRNHAVEFYGFQCLQRTLSLFLTKPVRESLMWTKMICITSMTTGLILMQHHGAE